MNVICCKVKHTCILRLLSMACDDIMPNMLMRVWLFAAKSKVYYGFQGPLLHATSLIACVSGFGCYHTKIPSSKDPV